MTEKKIIIRFYVVSTIITVALIAMFIITAMRGLYVEMSVFIATTFIVVVLQSGFLALIKTIGETKG